MRSIFLFRDPLSFIYSSTLMTKIYHKCHTNVVYNNFMLVLFWEYGKRLGNLRLKKKRKRKNAISMSQRKY